jgi:hypothetical protein
MSGPRGATEWIVGLVVLAGLGGGLTWVLAGGDASPAPEPPSAPDAELVGTFPPIEVPASVLEAWEAEQALQHEPLDGSGEEVLLTWSVSNFVAVAHGHGLFEGDAEAAAREHREAVRRFMVAREPSEYRALSWRAWARFTDCVAWLPTEAGRIYVQGEPPDLSDPATLAALEGCGDFGTVGRRLGIIDGDGQVTVDAAVLAVIFRYRWMQAAAGERAIPELVPGAELQVFHRWRFEQAAGIPLEDRLRQVGDFFRQFPDFALYREDDARRILLARETGSGR